MPYCTVIAGPNGSGKSTIYPKLEPVGEFVNVDVAARELNSLRPESAAIAAGRLVLRRIEELLEGQSSFVYETTLSSHQSIALMDRCKQAGYEVALVFLALRSPKLGIDRIEERVRRGGHHIPEKIVKRRYVSSFTRLPRALQLSDSALIFDNSNPEPSLMLKLENSLISTNNLDEAEVLHVRIANAVAEALEVTPDAILRPGARL